MVSKVASCIRADPVLYTGKCGTYTANLDKAQERVDRIKRHLNRINRRQNKSGPCFRNTCYPNLIKGRARGMPNKRFWDVYADAAAETAAPKTAARKWK